MNPPSHRRVGTPTDHDRTRILDAAKVMRDAEKTMAAAEAKLKTARELRDTTIRDIHHSGVKTEYIVALLHEGNAPLSRAHIAHVVGARPATFNAAEAVKRYQAGESARTLTREYRVGLPTLKQALQDAGVPLRDRETAKQIAQGQWQPPFDITDATKRYQAGESINKLRIDYGCSFAVVKRALEEAGVELRDQETAKQVAREQVTA